LEKSIEGRRGKNHRCWKECDDGFYHDRGKFCSVYPAPCEDLRQVRCHVNDTAYHTGTLRFGAGDANHLRMDILKIVHYDKWYSILMKPLTKASRVNIAIQVIQHMNGS
jgi:hypothetical protein